MKHRIIFAFGATLSLAQFCHGNALAQTTGWQASGSTLQAVISGTNAPASVTSSGYSGTGDNLSVTATGSTTARTLADRTAGVINVLDYGAKCDGSTDDTSALQAAFTAGVGQKIVLPAGQCLFTSLTLVGSSSGIGAGTVVEGKGRGVSWLRQTTATGDAIVVGNTSGTSTYNYVFRDLSIFPTVSKTSGFQLHLRKVLTVYLDSVDMGSDLTKANFGNYVYGGVWADGAGSVHLEQVEIIAQNEGFLLNNSVDSSLHYTNLRYATKNLHFAGGVDGLHCTQSNIESGYNNFYVDNSIDTSDGNRGNFFGTSCAFDTASSDNIVINTSLGGLNQWVFDGASIATQNGDGVKIIAAPNASDLIFNSTLIGSYSGSGTGHGIETQDASTTIQVTGSSFIWGNTGYGIYANIATPSSAPLYIDQSTIWNVASRGNTLGNTNFDYSYVRPSLSNATAIGDTTNGDSVYVVGCSSNCVNQVELKGNVTSGPPTISAVGGDTNINLALQPKGTGYVQINNGAYLPNLTADRNVCTDGNKVLTSCGNRIAASGATSITWTGLSGYDTYVIDCFGVQPSANGDTWELFTGYGTTPTYLSAWGWAGIQQNPTPQSVAVGSSSINNVALSATTGITNNTAYSASAHIVINNAQSSTAYKQIRVQSNWSGTTGIFYNADSGFQALDSNPITAVKIQMSTGNITGTCTLRGGAS